jgi:hypothetical protein
LGDDEKNTASEKKKSVYRLMLDFHPQFLKAIKDVYPLGVLSSLSMTIAAFITSFAEDSLALAQTYAIAASLMFLSAFSISLVLRLFLALEKNEGSPSLGQYALLSYICTGSGIAFLFLVVAQFMSVLSIAKVLLPALAIGAIGWILSIVPAIINMTKHTKSKTLSVLGYLTIVCHLLAVLCIILFILSIWGVALPFPILWGYLLVGSLGLSVPFLFAMIILSYRREKK